MSVTVRKTDQQTERDKKRKTERFKQGEKDTGIQTDIDRWTSMSCHSQVPDLS